MPKRPLSSSARRPRATANLPPLKRARRLQSLRGHVNNVLRVATLPNGKIVTGSDDGDVRVYGKSATVGRVIRHHAGGVLALEVLPGGVVVTGGRDGIAVCRGNGEVKGYWACGGVGGGGRVVSAVTALGRGTFVGVADWDVGRVEGELLWFSGEKCDVMKRAGSGHRDVVNDFASCGDMCVSAGADGRIVVWKGFKNVANVEVVAEGQGRRELYSVGLCERYCVVGGRAERVWVFEVGKWDQGPIACFDSLGAKVGKLRCFGGGYFGIASLDGVFWVLDARLPPRTWVKCRLKIAATELFDFLPLGGGTGSIIFGTGGRPSEGYRAVIMEVPHLLRPALTGQDMIPDEDGDRRDPGSLLPTPPRKKRVKRSFSSAMREEDRSRRLSPIQGDEEDNIVFVCETPPVPTGVVSDVEEEEDRGSFGEDADTTWAPMADVEEADDSETNESGISDAELEEWRIRAKAVETEAEAAEMGKTRRSKRQRSKRNGEVVRHRQRGSDAGQEGEGVEARKPDELMVVREEQPCPLNVLDSNEDDRFNVDIEVAMQAPLFGGLGSVLPDGGEGSPPPARTLGEMEDETLPAVPFDLGEALLPIWLEDQGVAPQDACLNDGGPNPSDDVNGLGDNGMQVREAEPSSKAQGPGLLRPKNIVGESCDSHSEAQAKDVSHGEGSGPTNPRLDLNGVRSDAAPTSKQSLPAKQLQLSTVDGDGSPISIVSAAACTELSSLDGDKAQERDKSREQNNAREPEKELERDKAQEVDIALKQDDTETAAVPRISEEVVHSKCEVVRLSIGTSGDSTLPPYLPSTTGTVQKPGKETSGRPFLLRAVNGPRGVDIPPFSPITGGGRAARTVNDDSCAGCCILEVAHRIFAVDIPPAMDQGVSPKSDRHGSSIPANANVTNYAAVSNAYGAEGPGGSCPLDATMPPVHLSWNHVERQASAEIPPETEPPGAVAATPKSTDVGLGVSAKDSALELLNTKRRASIANLLCMPVGFAKSDGSPSDAPSAIENRKPSSPPTIPSEGKAAAVSLPREQQQTSIASIRDPSCVPSASPEPSLLPRDLPSEGRDMALALAREQQRTLIGANDCGDSEMEFVDISTSKSIPSRQYFAPQGQSTFAESELLSLGQADKTGRGIPESTQRGLAAWISAFLVGYDVDRLEEFCEVKKVLKAGFGRAGVDGRQLLVRTFDESRFVDFFIGILEGDKACFARCFGYRMILPDALNRFRTLSELGTNNN